MLGLIDERENNRGQSSKGLLGVDYGTLASSLTPRLLAVTVGRS